MLSRFLQLIVMAGFAAAVWFAVWFHFRWCYAMGVDALPAPVVKGYHAFRRWLRERRSRRTRVEAWELEKLRRASTREVTR